MNTSPPNSQHVTARPSANALDHGAADRLGVRSRAAASRLGAAESRLPQAARSRGSDYAQLARQVQAAGLLRRRPLAYSILILFTTVLFTGSWVAVALVGDSLWQAVVAVVAGVASTQVAFLGHDGGHQQVFASRRANDRFGRLIANLLLGLSYGS